MSGEGFTLEDFIEQLGMLRKLGPIKNMLGMMPGAAKNKELLDQVNDKDLDRAEAIVRSMTPGERRNPKIINGSRRLRIANGSGATVGEVSQLVTNFFEGQKQMADAAAAAMPGMPGDDGRPAPGGRPRPPRSRQKGKRRSGDPRKAALAASGGGQGGQGGQGGDQQAAQAAGPGQRRRPRWRSWRRCCATRRPPGRLAARGGDDGFAGFRGGPSALPQFPGGGLPQGNVPAAFGKRNNKKKK